VVDERVQRERQQSAKGIKGEPSLAGQKGLAAGSKASGGGASTPGDLAERHTRQVGVIGPAIIRDDGPFASSSCSS
jgi:hypothetical protein